MAVVPHPPQLPDEPSDKVQHVIAFTTLALLASWAYATSRPLTLLIGLSVFGALIEAVQAISFLHRDPELLDWIADTVAVTSVLLLIGLARRWRTG